MTCRASARKSPARMSSRCRKWTVTGRAAAESTKRAPSPTAWAIITGPTAPASTCTPPRPHRPLLACRHHLLPKYDSTGPLSIQRSALEVTLRCAGRLLRVYSVHLTHLSAATRLPQVEALLAIHAGAAFEGAAVSGDLGAQSDFADAAAGAQSVPEEAVVLGDFNFQPDSAEYQRMAGPLSDYGGRITHPKGFVDAWRATGGDAAGGFTSDVNGRPARLDYCFVSSALREYITACRVDTQATGSDHFPLWTQIEL